MITYHETQLQWLREEVQTMKQERRNAERDLQRSLDRSMREMRQQQREALQKEHQRLLSEQDAQFHQQKRVMDAYVERMYAKV